MIEQNANPDDVAASRVAEQLKSAFAAVASSELPPEEKGRWHRRLLAVTNMTKHDVARAAEQMHRVIDEWNALDEGKELQQ